METEPFKTVLLVEDDPELTELIHSMFEQQSQCIFDLSHVKSIADAGEYLAQHSVDIILLDFGLPDARGLEAIRRVHAVDPRASIVLLVSADDEKSAPQGVQAGAQDFLVKAEFGPRELVRVLLNVCQRRQVEDMLFFEKERAQVTLDCIGDAVICTDVAGHITFMNRVAERMTGWIQINAVGRQMAEACRIVDSTTREAILDPMGLAVSQNRTGKLPSNCVLIRRDGLDIPIEDSISPIRDRIGRVTGAVIVFRDVSGTRALQEELAHAACHDALTGLPNRVLMTDRVSQAILLARRQRSQSAILFIDLDGFKHINDSLGHVIGDKLLQSVSGRLLACVRAPDTVCRQGGDEFVVLLQELRHASDAAITAKRMLRAIAAVYLIDNREIFVTGSIGVSVYPGDGTDAETLIKNADAAMYQAKRNGHHDYRFFDPDIDDHAAERYSTEQSLRGALERKEFTLHYQPKFDLKSGAISGAEALLRWTHPVLGSVLPSRFIPIAEESGLIVPIGAWVLHEACLQARAWAEAGLTVAPIAVNVSAVQFRSESFLQNLFADLSETGLDPQQGKRI